MGRGISTSSSALNAAMVASRSSLTLQAKCPPFGVTLRDESPVSAVTLRDEALGVWPNVSMFITVRGVGLRLERRIPLRGIGAKDTDLGAGLSTGLGCSIGSLSVIRGSVVGAGGLSVKTSATCTSASCWRGVSSVRSRSLRGSLGSC